METKRYTERENPSESVIYDLIDNLVDKKEYSLALIAVIRYERFMKPELIKSYRGNLLKKLREKHENKRTRIWLD